MTPEDYTGIVAAGAGIIAGIATIVRSNRVQRKEEAATPEQAHRPEGATMLPPVPSDPAGQREFMAILQRDNHDLREEISTYKDELAAIRRTVDEMQTDLRADKEWKVTFLDALARWLSRIFGGWDHSRPFPLPEGDDLVTLQDVIPRS